MPCKRSATLSTSAQHGQENFEEGVPPRKRTRKSKNTATTGTSGKSKREKLLVLMNLPLDVVYEIFSYLEPEDILHLSRINKALRKVLTHRSAAFVWRACIENLEDFPPCPPDLNELQYVNLAFSPHCHFCLKNDCIRIQWGSRVRCCSQCRSQYFVHPAALPYYFKFPYACDASPSKLLVPAQFPSSRGFRETLYLEKDLALAIKEVEAINQLKVADDVNKKKRLKRFLAERHAINARINELEHVKAYEQWQSLRTARHEQILENLRSKRIEAIAEKLTTLGWGVEIEKERALCRRNQDIIHETLFGHPESKLVELLTESEWARIQSDMVTFMEDRRKKRIAEDIKANMWTARLILGPIIFNSLKTGTVVPTIKNVAVFSLAPIPDIIINTAKEGADLTLDSFKDVLPSLSLIWAAYLAKNKSYLLSLIPTSDSSFPHEEFELELATTLFRFVTASGTNRSIFDGNDTLHEVDFWAKRQVLDLIFSDSTTSEEAQAYSEGWASHYLRESVTWYKWHNVLRPRFEYAIQLQPYIRHILDMCNKDPMTTKASEMDEMDPWFECDRCFENGLLRTVMHWRGAVRHCSECFPAGSAGGHGGQPSDSIRLSPLNEVDTNEARQALLLQKQFQESSERFYCGRCMADIAWRYFPEHIRIEHGIRYSPVLGRDALLVQGQSRSHMFDEKILLQNP